MRFESIDFLDIEPFRNGTKVVFPAKHNPSKAEVHLITGENGTGKTRILCLLAAALGNAQEFITRLEKNAKLIYANEKCMNIYLNETVLAKVVIESRSKNDIGFAFRTIPSFSNQSYLPITDVNFGDKSGWLTFDFSSKFDPQITQKIVSMLTKNGIAINSDDFTQRSLIISKRIEAIISSITGKLFKYSIIEVGDNKVKFVVKWGGKTLTMAQVPDGLRAVFKLLGSLAAVLDSTTNNDEDVFQQHFTLLIDEPETNLHPRWQRLILPAVQELFPNAVIFCVTHSPFIISSVNEGYVHILRLNEDGKVTFDPSSECSKGDTYRDAVIDVLGLEGVMEYDPETQRMLERFLEQKKVLTPDSNLDNLKALAKEIAGRSERLNFLMGGQIHQLEEQMVLAKGTKA